MKKAIISSIIIVVVIFCFFGSNAAKAATTANWEKSVSMVHDNLGLGQIGESKDITVRIQGRDISQYQVEWSSSNEAVVEVADQDTEIVDFCNDGQCKVLERVTVRATAVGVGSATVTAKVSVWTKDNYRLISSDSNAANYEADEVYEVDCYVEVNTEAAGIVITTHDLVITRRFAAQDLEFINYTAYSDDELIFTSDNENIAYTTWKGAVVANRNGEVTIHIMTPDRSSFATCQVTIEIPETDGLYYEIIDDNTVTVVGYDGIASEIIIPDEIEGLPVTKIAASAFRQENNLESVIISNTVFLIGAEAFSLCENLERVVLGEAVQTISYKAFCWSYKLAEINFPDSIEYFERYAFGDCISLETFVVPPNTKSVQLSPVGSLTGSVKLVNLSELTFDEFDLKRFSGDCYDDINNMWYSEPMGGERVTIMVPGQTVYRQFRITYHTINSDVGDNPQRYGIETDVILKPIANQVVDGVNYRFEGWYSDENYSQRIEVIERSNREPVTLYAKQIPQSRSNHSSSGGSGSTERSNDQKVVNVYAHPVQTNGAPVLQGNWDKQNELWRFIDLNGELVRTSWVYVQENWYFMNETGFMVTGWINVDGQWYLLHENGAMAVGWVYVNSGWYYLNGSGAMATGWILVNEKYYYLDASGKLLTSTKTPDGYNVNSNGEWIN